MKKIICVFIINILIFLNIFAAPSSAEIEPILEDTAQYIISVVPSPTYGSVGGEWMILGLLRSGGTIPDDYIKTYRNNMEQYVKSRNGILNSRKYTEYSRLAIVLTALGENPANFLGYDLLTPVSDYDKVIFQGINGAIWALIAIDCGGYNIPRSPYINEIISRQNNDGGFSLVKGGASEVDITCMALTALAKYKSREEVRSVIDKAVLWLSSMQSGDGGFSDYGAETVESTAQAIIALSALKIPIDDKRFVKNGNNLFDNLMTFKNPGGGFFHIKNETDSNLMATEQGLLALSALKRFYCGENSLFSIKEAEFKHMPFIISNAQNPITDLMIYEAKKHETFN